MAVQPNEHHDFKLPSALDFDPEYYEANAWVDMMEAWFHMPGTPSPFHAQDKI